MAQLASTIDQHAASVLSHVGSSVTAAMRRVKMRTIEMMQTLMGCY